MTSTYVKNIFEALGLFSVYIFRERKNRYLPRESPMQIELSWRYAYNFVIVKENFMKHPLGLLFSRQMFDQNHFSISSNSFSIFLRWTYKRRKFISKSVWLTILSWIYKISIVKFIRLPNEHLVIYTNYIKTRMFFWVQNVENTREMYFHVVYQMFLLFCSCFKKFKYQYFETFNIILQLNNEVSGFRWNKLTIIWES